MLVIIMSRLIKGAPFAFSILIGTQGTLAFYIDTYILMKISFKFIENFAEGGWLRSFRAHPLNTPMAVFRKSDEMVPIVPSKNPGSPMEEHQLTKSQKGVILG